MTARVLGICASKGGVLTTKEGEVFVPASEPYQGPTVPTWLVDAALKDQPGLGIPAGVVSNGVYHNQELGLQYEFPKGWNSIEAEANEDPPRNARQRREYELFQACSRTLLHVAPRGSNDAAAQGSRPAIILRALDPGCLAMRTPASVGDKRIANEISAELDLSSEFGEIKSDELISLEGRLFVVFRGTIGLRAPDEVLSRRMSEALFVTQHHKLLFMWSLMAPTSAQLDAMPPSSINFEASPSIRLLPADVRP